MSDAGCRQMVLTNIQHPTSGIFRTMDENIRKLFPVTEKYTYLNSAAVSPLPARSAEAVLSQLRDVSENGTVNYLEWIETKNRARALIAEMLNVRSEQIAFMRNTSDG